MLKCMSIAAVALITAVPASAQITFDDTPATGAANAKDPKAGQLICERHEEIGSRVAAKKVCKTAAQWEQQRRQERQAVEDMQRQNTSTGTPSGSI
jgi:hypothetical protein